MPPRPREFDPSRVLDAAMTTFWKKGYAGTSAQDLVDSTTLGRGSLYNAFDSKHGVFTAALHHYDVVQTSRLVALLEEGEGPALDRIRTLLLSVVEEELKEAPKVRGCLMVNSAMELAGRDQQVTEIVRHAFALMERALTVCVEQGQRDGTIGRDQDARRLAQYLLNAMYGLRVLGKISDRETLVGIVDRTLAPL